MTRFLEELAKYINANNKNGLSDCCLVFPSRRAGVYFLKYLSDMHELPAWAPAVRTMGDLILELNNSRTSDNLSLIVELYRVFCKHTKSNESFDSFYFWGEMLLSDFDDIDKQLVQASDLFQNIADLKKIESDLSYLSDTQIEAIRTFWKNFEGGKSSSEKENFSQLWREMNSIYSEFKNSLLNSGQAYEGMIFRELIEKIKSGGEPEIPWKKIYIAGFNILNECEKSLFRFLQKKKIAEFFWDYDEVYITDPDHEAGAFMRENLREFPSAISGEIFRNLQKPDKRVYIMAESSQTGQAVTAGSLLEKLKREQNMNFENTAVVLADESLLMPFLYAIPESCSDVNITMGLQVTDTPIFSYVESIIALSQNARKLNGKTQYYHRDLISFLKNRYLREERDKLQSLEESIQASNRVYLNAEELFVSEAMRKILPVPDSLSEFISYLRNLLYDLFTSLPEPEDDPNPDISLLEKESVYGVFITISRLQEIFLRPDIKLELPTFRILLRKLLNQQKINFTGEPLRGLQLMGLLETRCLDFETVILLSANEDILPKKSNQHSFIPYNLRKGFGMSTPERQDAMYAYYFYRLIQRSSNVYLLFNSIASGLNKGEMSRYLYQLKFTSPYKIIEQAQVHTIGTLMPKIIRIQKKDKVWDKMKEFESRPLTPSALCTFLDCSLKFYFQYIAGIKKSSEIFEEVDRLAFGSILHEAIAEIYADHMNKHLDRDALSTILHNKSLIDKVVKDAINKIISPGQKGLTADISGKNLIVAEILKKYISGIIENDMASSPIEILDLEKKVSVSFAARAGADPIFINLGGILDRIDKADGIKRIIDYKTGGRQKTIQSLSDLIDPEKGTDFHAAFQILAYCFIVSKETGSSDIQPGIYYLKEIFGEKYDSRLSYAINDEKKLSSFQSIQDEFELILSELLNRIFNPALPFVQTDELDTCKKCEFASICHRD
jgi:hypothetical protein